MQLPITILPGDKRMEYTAESLEKGAGRCAPPSLAFRIRATSSAASRLQRTG